MPLTLNSTTKVYVNNTVTGYACATIPPEIAKSAFPNVGTSGWVKTVPDKMDIKAFFRANGYMPVRSYKKNGESVSVSTGTVFFRTKPLPDGCASFRNNTTDFKVHLGFAPYADVSHSSATKTDALFLNLKTVALTRLYDKVKAEHAGLGETIVQGRQATNMIAEAAVRIAKAARHVKKFEFKDAALELGISVPKRVSKRYSFTRNWLAYRYGWMPLIYDSYGTMVALWEHTRLPVVKSINAKAKFAIAPVNRSRIYSGESYFDSSNTCDNSPSLDWTITREGTAEYVVRAGFVIEFTNTNIATLTSLGLADPVGIVWELVPFSFLIDWFVNIGDVISSMTAFNGKKMKAHYITHYFVSRINSRVSYVSRPNASIYPVFNSAPASSMRASYWIDREIFSQPQVVQLQFSNGLNPVRLMDAVSLLRASQSSNTKRNDQQWAAELTSFTKRAKAKSNSQSTGNWRGGDD